MGRRGFASADREEIDEVVGELFGGFEGLPVRDVVDDLEAMREQLRTARGGSSAGAAALVAGERVSVVTDAGQ
jgi:hypothetical protein